MSDASPRNTRAVTVPQTMVERLIASGIAPALSPWLRETWTGLEHIPAEGPVIVAGNHLSNADAFVIGRFLLVGTGRMPRFLGKAEVFAVPVIGSLLRRAGQIPVHRGSAQAADSFAAALDALGGGQLVSLLPEGTLTRDPQLWPMAGKTGAARLALTSGAPLIPVAMWGPEQILPPRQLSARIVMSALRPRHPVMVVAGPALDLEDLREQEISPQVLTEATARLMAAITDLLIQVRGCSPSGPVMENPRVISSPAKHSAGRGFHERRSS